MTSPQITRASKDDEGRLVLHCEGGPAAWDNDCPQPGNGGVHYDPADTGSCVFCGARERYLQPGQPGG